MPPESGISLPLESQRAGGEWEVEVVVRVSPSDQHERTIDLPVPESYSSQRAVSW